MREALQHAAGLVNRGFLASVEATGHRHLYGFTVLAADRTEALRRSMPSGEVSHPVRGFIGWRLVNLGLRVLPNETVSA